MRFSTDNPDAREAWRKRDLLGATQFKNTRLHASLLGCKKAFCKFFKLSEIAFVHNNDVKILQRQSLRPEYPYSYMSVTSVGMNDQSINPNTARRHGVGHSANTANSTVDKHYYFPVVVTLEFHYVTNDYLDAMRFISEALILSNTKALNFKITFEGTTGFVIITPETREFSLPRADKEAENEPEAFDITATFRLETWMGVSKAVAKINNMGEVEFGTYVVNGAGEIIGEDHTTITTADKS